MKPSRITRRAILSAAAEVGEQDGRDPRYDRIAERRKVPNRKALQLCAQVAEILSSVLAGECRDEALADVVVESVVPAPNAGRLLATIGLGRPDAAVDVELALAGLDRATPLFRRAIAEGTNRRFVPDLIFRMRLP
jgi:ribosome-binding factor A